jgi:hypothetical protein
MSMHKNCNLKSEPIVNIYDPNIELTDLDKKVLDIRMDIFYGKILKIP